MKQVKIAEFKTHLSRHLHAVARGEELVILDRSVPVARVVPYRSSGRPGLVIREPTKDPAELARLSFPPIPGKKTDVVATLLEDRNKR